jgi:hypothetical protein
MGFLLIWFQSSLDIRRSAWHIVNILLVTGFALAFAADVVFHTGTGWHFTQDPRTYIALNAALYLVYLVEMVRTRLSIGTVRPTSSSSGATSTMAAFATDFGGLALALLAFGLVSGEAAVESGSDAQLPPATRMGASLRQILATAGDELTFTIRWAFGPLIWLLTTFSLAYLAKIITDYLNTSSTSTRVVDLFNPFSITSQGRYWEGLLSIELMVVAAGATITCIALIEHRVATIERALQIVRQSSQIIILSFAFFTFSLAAINALVVFADVDISTRVEREVAGQHYVMPYIIRAANRKTFRELHDEIRAAQVADVQHILTQLQYVPPRLIRPFIWAFTVLANRYPKLWKKMMGTVGISSVGMFGTGSGWGIPASALMVTVGGIGEQHVLLDGHITVHEYLSLTISVDHDIVDGAPAARFTQRLKELIESGFGLDTIAAEFEQITLRAP